MVSSRWCLRSGTRLPPRPASWPTTSLRIWTRRARAALPHQALPLASPQGPLAKEGEALLTGISQRGLGLVEHQPKLSHHPFVNVSASAARRWPRPLGARSERGHRSFSDVVIG